MPRSDGRGTWNRAGRRSGGYRPAKIQASSRENLPLTSIQCFEGRHADCLGLVEFAPGKCECACHREAAHAADR
jgi:hypothetical protein